MCYLRHPQTHCTRRVESRALDNLAEAGVRSGRATRYLVSSWDDIPRAQKRYIRPDQRKDRTYYARRGHARL
jgi:hypothetical protein